METDTLWRLYSMTKPITSVAAMMLYEEADSGSPIRSAPYIPSFAGVRVYAGGSDLRPVSGAGHRAGPDLAPADPHRRPHLRVPSRASGGCPLPCRRVDGRGHRPTWTGPGLRRHGRLPLLFQPGAEWNYSVATDVLGRVVEVVSGQTLEEFFATRIFGPLGMTGTGFTRR